jgi:AAA+ ATPase superfamily predicted ATPase
MFIGRTEELSDLNERFSSSTSQLLIIYGRRRIGKSQLLKTFSKNKLSLFFEGIEGAHRNKQIENCVLEFSKQTKKTITAKLKLTKWEEFFELLTDHFKQNPEKKIIILDEFQWMANQQSFLVSLIKFYWDNYWKNQNVMLILCGSVAHYMVKKVIQSKALYGRINYELCLQPLTPYESRKMLSRRGDFESLKYMMIFGGIPKYLEEINQNLSFDENINRLCFQRNGFFTNEIDKIFFSQFKEATTYKKIIEQLAVKNLNLTEISNKLKIVSGGGLRSYLFNLEKAGFIRSYSSYGKNGRKLQKYKLFDEYLIFYFKFISKNKKQIEENTKQNLFKLVVTPHWNFWLGIAFEVFCLKNAMYLAEIAGFADEVISFAPLFSMKDHKFQIDLIFNRDKNIHTLCEIKYSETPIATSVIPEVKRKVQLLQCKKSDTVETMLIAPFGADKALQQSEYFHHILNLNDIFKA